MRTIKFRGKSLFSNQWSYGYPARIDGNWHMITDDDFEEDGHHLHQISDMPTWVDKDTICQFTDICDVNGKEIYEGDILRSTATNNKFSVRWVNGQVILVDNDGLFIDNNFVSFCKHAEIVGNIYDNYEILNK